MRLPEVKDGERYVGLYVVDFGDHCGVGFTGEEVAELLDSEKFRDVKVFRIHNAYPDGKMELVVDTADKIADYTVRSAQSGKALFAGNAGSIYSYWAFSWGEGGTLWVHSSDIGGCCWARSEDGTWNKHGLDEFITSTG